MDKKLRLGHLPIWLGSLLLALMGTLSACGKQEIPVLHTTISVDGQIVATLLHAGTDKQQLRVRNLGTANSWHTLQAPPLTQSIRFGLQGHELLLTHRRPTPPKFTYLSKLDLDQPDKAPQRIYEAYELAFPVEVSPGQVLVRTGDSHQQGSFSTGVYWIVVGPEKQIQKVGPKSMPYAAPNIVGSGFFWMEDQIGINDEAHPKLHQFAFPGGKAPDIPAETFEKNTFDVICDRRADRCLRQYITNLRKGEPFIYDVEVMLGSERCQVRGVAGISDDVSITPDGKTSVMSLASAYGNPRHVVVMQFRSNQCEAISVQHFNFEEK